MKRVGVYTSEDEKKYPKIDKDNLVNSMGVCANCKEQNLEYGAIQLEGGVLTSLINVIIVG